MKRKRHDQIMRWLKRHGVVILRNGDQTIEAHSKDDFADLSCQELVAFFHNARQENVAAVKVSR